MSFRDLIAVTVCSIIKLLQHKCPKKSWILVWRAKDCGKRIWQNEKGNMWEIVEKACVGSFQVQLMAQFRIFPRSKSRHSFVANYTSAVKFEIHILFLFCCIFIPLQGYCWKFLLMGRWRISRNFHGP